MRAASPLPVLRHRWDSPPVSGGDESDADSDASSPRALAPRRLLASARAHPAEPAPAHHAVPPVSLTHCTVMAAAYVIALVSLWALVYFAPMGHYHKAKPGPVPPDDSDPLREVHRWTLLHPASGHTFVVYHWHPEHPALEHATRVDAWHRGARLYSWWPPHTLRLAGAPCGTQLYAPDLAPAARDWEELFTHDPATLTALHPVAHDLLARRALAPPACAQPRAGAECVAVAPPAAPPFSALAWRADERRFADEWHQRLHHTALHWVLMPAPLPGPPPANLTALGWRCDHALAFLRPACDALHRCARHPARCTARGTVSCLCVRRALAALETGGSGPAAPCAACVPGASAGATAACQCWAQWLAARRALLAQPCAHSQRCRAEPVLVLCAPDARVTTCAVRTVRPCVLTLPALDVGRDLRRDSVWP